MADSMVINTTYYIGVFAGAMKEVITGTSVVILGRSSRA